MKTQVKTQVKRLNQQNHLVTIATGLLLSALAATLLFASSATQADSTSPAPSTQYEPQEVVEIVVSALQANSEENNDAGIATVYSFASPGNRANTGPLERFARMVKGGFPDMLNHLGARYEPIEITGNNALQAVWLTSVTGKETGYAFKMGKQLSGEYKGMWMTEAVIPLGLGAQSGTRI